MHKELIPADGEWTFKKLENSASKQPDKLATIS